jgi:hypothetical protein
VRRERCSRITVEAFSDLPSVDGRCLRQEREHFGGSIRGGLLLLDLAAMVVALQHERRTVRIPASAGGLYG